jgi:hypothetical protein
LRYEHNGPASNLGQFVTPHFNAVGEEVSFDIGEFHSLQKMFEMFLLLRQRNQPGARRFLVHKADIVHIHHLQCSVE